MQRIHAGKLTRASEFKAVLGGSYRASGASFLLRANPAVSVVSAADLAQARLGLIASRKAARRAVDRNRGKRIAREAFRAARAGLPAVDVVLQLKNDLRKAGNRSLRWELDRLLSKLHSRFGVVEVASTALSTRSAGAASPEDHK